MTGSLLNVVFAGPPIGGGVYTLVSGGNPSSIVLGLGLIGLGAYVLWPRSGWYRWGVAVTAESQPALYRMVERVAGSLGVPVPDRVWLTGGGELQLLGVGRRTELRIGRPLLACLSRRDVEALIAHELSLLRQPYRRLVLRLRTQCLEELGRDKPRALRKVARLGEFWSIVESDCDRAAAGVVGTAELPRVVATADLANVAFFLFTMDVGQSPRALGRRRWTVIDVDDGWRRALAHGVDLSNDEDDRATISQVHPGLAGGLAALDELPLRPTDDPVELAPLSDEDQQRLAVRSFFVTEPKQARWCTFAGAPPQWWVLRAEDDVVRMWRANDEQQGRSLNRDGLVAAITDGPGLAVYAESVLLDKGWQLEHPAVRSVMVSPDGERFDLTTMDKQAVLALIAPSLIA